MTRSKGPWAAIFVLGMRALIADLLSVQDFEYEMMMELIQ